MKEGLLLRDDCFIVLKNNNLCIYIIKIAYSLVISIYPGRNKIKCLLIKRY